MTLPTQIRRLIEEHLAPMVLLPELAGAVMAVTGGLVERLFGLAEGGVRRGHELPVEQLKPRLFHAAA